MIHIVWGWGNKNIPKKNGVSRNGYFKLSDDIRTNHRYNNWDSKPEAGQHYGKTSYRFDWGFRMITYDI